MINFQKIEENILSDLEIDYISLNDIVRFFSGFDKLPDDTDFNNAIRVLDSMITKHNLKYLEGPNMTEIKLEKTEFLHWLKSVWDNGKFNEINYCIWFDKNE